MLTAACPATARSRHQRLRGQWPSQERLQLTEVITASIVWNSRSNLSPPKYLYRLAMPLNPGFMDQTCRITTLSMAGRRLPLIKKKLSSLQLSVWISGLSLSHTRNCKWGSLFWLICSCQSWTSCVLYFQVNDGHVIQKDEKRKKRANWSLKNGRYIRNRVKRELGSRFFHIYYLRILLRTNG